MNQTPLNNSSSYFFSNFEHVVTSFIYILAFLIVDRYSVFFFSSIALYYGESAKTKRSFPIYSIYTYIYLLLLCVFQTLVIFFYSLRSFYFSRTFHFSSCVISTRKQKLFTIFYVYTWEKEKHLTQKTFRTYL
jgi:hypothetical protein